MEESYQQEDEDRDNPLYAAAFNPDSDEKDESLTRPIGPLDMALMDEQRIEPTKDASINAADVLCGRGKMSFNHVGNKRFRDAVSNALDEYMKADTRFEKSLVVHNIVDSIRAEGGRFLKKDFREGRWYELSQQQSKEKVGHAIRDAANLYEARHKKEKEIQRSSGDRSAGESRSGLKPLPHYAAAAAHPDYSDSSVSTSRAAKKRSSSGYQSQRKRRRAASPLHLPVEKALSAPVLAASLPSRLKRSPIVQPPQQYTHTGALPTVDPISSAMAASLPVALQRSPIVQQQHHGQLHQQQQQHSGSSLGQASPAAVQMQHLQPPPPQQQRRGSFSSFEPLPYGPPVLQQQHLPHALPVAPHAAAADSVPHLPGRLSVSMAAGDTSAMRVPPAVAARMPHEPPHHHHEPAMNEPFYDPRDPVARMQMLQQQQQREQYFQQRHQPHVPPLPGGRNDDNDHFLAAINAVLGPLAPDAEDLIEPYDDVADPQHLLQQQYQRQLRELQRRQQQHEEDEGPPPHQPPPPPR